MYIVDQTGNGDFTSIQAAVDAVPSGERAPTILLIRAGVYNERVVIYKDNLRVIGEDPENTVLTFSACAKDRDGLGGEQGTFRSFTLIVTGRDVEVENLTIRNDAGDGRDVGQAVAVYAAGDRGVWRKCRMIAHQDTLLCAPVMPMVENFIAPRLNRCEWVPHVPDSLPTRSRQYFEDCLIQGDVDFIFGPYRCWFERCELRMNARGGWYTAANTPEEQPYGMVFHKCHLTGECGDRMAALGRPWRRFARTVFLECEMNACVAPDGFRDWDEEKVVTERYAEYATTGARADLSLRHPKQKILTEDEASEFTVAQVMGGADGWRPDRRVPTWFMCGDSTMTNYRPDQAPMMGWGQAVQPLLEDNIFVENLAVSGRSSKSFVDERRLENIDRCIREGDTLLISFSHNDEKSQDPSRYTTAWGTFPEYLKMYLDVARKHGATPVLVTPIARRIFDDQGVLQASHQDYPASMRAFAEKENVRLIDLEAATMEDFQREGVEGTKLLYCHMPAGTPNYPEGIADNSHLHQRGARRIARLFMALWRGELQVNGVREADAADFSDTVNLEDSILKKEKGE